MNTSAIQITREMIASRANKIHLADRDEETGLELYCYNHCHNDEDEIVQSCCGVVLNGEKTVLQAFSYTREYSAEDAKIEEVLQPWAQWTFYEAHEGALLRMFYHGGKWYLSTRRKLNAERSKWSSPESFATIFRRGLRKVWSRADQYNEDQIWNAFQDSLDQKKQYMFLVLNTADNRIVCYPPAQYEHPIYHVGTFCPGDVPDGPKNLTMDVDIGLPGPAQLHFADCNALRQYVLKMDPLRLQGVIGFGPFNTQVKILHPDYMNMFKIRGNEPSVKFRYLQVRMNRKMVEGLYKLYPNMITTFEQYERVLLDIARSILGSYIQRFIKKDPNIIVPPEEYQVMRECHAWHMLNRSQNRISLNRVIAVLNKQPPTNLNRMIRRFQPQAEDVPRYPRSLANSASNSPAIGPALSLPPPPVLSREN